MIKKQLSKLNDIPIQAKASIAFLICSFLQKGISFLTTPIFTRLLSTAEYGEYNVFFSWMNILSAIISLNLYLGVYNRGLVVYEKERNILTSSFYGLTLTLVILWSIIYFLFRDFWNALLSLTTVQMLMMLCMIWTAAIYGFWSTEQRVDNKYWGIVKVTVFTTILKPILGIIFVQNSQDKVTARIFAILLVELIAYTGLFIRQMNRGRRFCVAKYWKYGLAFNLPLIPHYLSMSLLNTSDRIMISNMVNDSAAGIYSLAHSIAFIMTMINTSVLQTVEPWMYKRIKQNKPEDIAKISYYLLVLVATCNLILMIFAPEAVRIFAPQEYYEATWIIPPLAMSVYFMFSYNLFAVFEFYYQQTKYISLATVVGAVANIILNYIFINLFGYRAAAYTSLFCYIIYALMHYLVMSGLCKQYFQEKEVYSGKKVFLITVLFLAAGFFVQLTYQSMIVRYAFLFLCIMTAILNSKQIIKIVHMLLQSKTDA